MTVERHDGGRDDSAALDIGDQGPQEHEAIGCLPTSGHAALAIQRGKN